MLYINLFMMIFLSKFNKYYSVVVFDKDLGGLFDITGKATYTVNLKSIDFVLEVHGSFYNCERHRFTGSACDFAVVYTYCLTTLSFDQDWDDKYNNNQWDYDTPSDPEYKKGAQYYYDSDIDKHVNGYCDGLKHYFLPEDYNFIYRTFGDMFALDKITYWFCFMCYFRIMTCNVLIGDDIEKYTDMEFKAIRPNISYDYNIYRQTQYLSVQENVFYLEAVVEVKCLPEHYGQTCFFKCINSIHQKCYCPPEARATSQPCNITCSKDYLQLFLHLWIAGFYYYYTPCALFNVCHGQGMSCNYTCLPLTNSTSICQNIRLLILSQFNDENITSYVYLNEEYIHISVFYDKDTHPYIYINSTFTFITENNTLLQRGMLDDVTQGSELVFKIKADIYFDTPFEMKFRYIIYAWQLSIPAIYMIRFYDLPHSMALYGFSGSRPLENALIAGDSILCNSSAKPFYRTVTLISIRKFGIPVIPADTIVIPETVHAVYGTIDCNITLIIQDRRLFTFGTSRYVKFAFVAGYGFIPLNNLLNNTNKLTCVVNSFLSYTMKIFQVIGNTDIEKIEGVFNLTMARGDFFSFGCMLIFNNSIITKYKILSIMIKPSQNCFFIFPHVPGSIIQCGHDGFVRDEFDRYVQLFEAATNVFLMESNEGYIKIPYNTQLVHLKQTCTITCDRLNYSETINQVVEILDLSSFSYTYKASEKFCSTTAAYVGFYDVEKSSETSIILQHQIYYLFFSTNCYQEFFIFFIIIYLNMIILLLSMAYIKSGLRPNSINDRRHLQLINYLQDRLNVETRNCILAMKQEKRSSGKIFSYYHKIMGLPIEKSTSTVKFDIYVHYNSIIIDE